MGTYTFTGSDPAGDTNAPVGTNAMFSPFSRVNVTAAVATDLFRSTEWTLTGSRDSSEFVEFTVTPASNYALTLTSISFDIERSLDKLTPSEKDGQLNGEIRIFRGVSLTSVGSHLFAPEVTVQNVYFDFADFTTLDGEPVTVRFYGWNAGHHNGWLDIDNVSVNGSANIVPEPSAASMMSLGFLLLLINSSMRHNRRA